MTESEIKEAINELPVGSKIQVIKTNGDILDLVLADKETKGIEKKAYDGLEVPAMPPAIIVQGGRWGNYRLEISEIVNISRVG